MRKLYLFNMMTLDGLFEGPTKWDLSWHIVDAEFNQFAIEQLDSTGIILFGRVTYEGMASYWSSENATKDDPIVAGKMNSIPKIVFSKTLARAEWHNTKLVKEDAGKEIDNLKRQGGKDIAIFGSASLASGLIKEGLIDEFRIILNPVVLGKGRPLFGNIETKTNLRLERMKSFKSGNVLLYYTPAG